MAKNSERKKTEKGLVSRPLVLIEVKTNRNKYLFTDCNGLILWIRWKCHENIKTFF